MQIQPKYSKFKREKCYFDIVVFWIQYLYLGSASKCTTENYEPKIFGQQVSTYLCIPIVHLQTCRDSIVSFSCRHSYHKKNSSSSVCLQSCKASIWHYQCAIILSTCLSSISSSRGHFSQQQYPSFLISDVAWSPIICYENITLGILQILWQVLAKS